jgi:hypothetical protein
MVDIPALVLHHDEQVVPTLLKMASVEMALAAGVSTRAHVLNLLHRLIDGKTTNEPDIHFPGVHVSMHERGHSAGPDPAQ